MEGGCRFDVQVKIYRWRCLKDAADLFREGF